MFTLVLKQEHIRGIQYLDDWLFNTVLDPLLLEHRKHFFQLYKDSGIVITFKVRPQAHHEGSISRNADIHYLRNYLPDRLSNCQILMHGGNVSFPDLSISKDVAADSRPHGLLGKLFCSHGRGQEVSPSVMAEVGLVSIGRRPSSTSPSSRRLQG